MRMAVFVSGRGSNLASLLECRPVSLVVASKENCPAVRRAHRAGVEVLIQSKQDNWDDLTKALKNRKIGLLFLAGFMRILPGRFVEQWNGKILNIHPSLLPEYKGLESIKRAHEDGAEIGASVHHVDADVDSGSIVRQRNLGRINRNLDDTYRSVHICEHRIVNEALNCLG